MGPAEAVKHCLKNYRNFYGRAQRSEFWWFLGFDHLLGLVISIIGIVIFGENAKATSYVLITSSLILALPFAAVFARRLHDVNRSGWWQLIFWAAFPLAHFKVTERMLSDTLPSVVNWITAIIGLIYVIMFLVVIAQWFRKSKAPNQHAKVDDQPIIADAYRVEEFTWKPSPKDNLYGCYP